MHCWREMPRGRHSWWKRIFSSIRAGAVGAGGTLAAPVAGGPDPGQPVPLGRAGVDLAGSRASKELPRLLAAAEQLLASGDRDTSDAHDPLFRLLRGLIATLWSLFHFFTGQAQASLESARSALARIPPGEEHMVSHANYYFALSNQATGHEEVALAAVQQGLQDHSTRLSSTARLLFAQAYVYLAMAKRPHVEHTARHLLHIAREGELVISQNYAHWLLGLVHYEQNRLEEATYHFSAVIANQHQAHFWVVRDALCGLALTYQAQGLGYSGTKDGSHLARTGAGAARSTRTDGSLCFLWALGTVTE